MYKKIKNEDVTTVYKCIFIGQATINIKKLKFHTN